jgi:hypothetical protein
MAGYSHFVLPVPTSSMSLISPLHSFPSFVQCHAVHTPHITSGPTQCSIISTILSPPSKSQATCELQHTIPLPPSYKRRPPSLAFLLIIYSIKTTSPQTHELLPSTPFPITFHNVLHQGRSGGDQGSFAAQARFQAELAATRRHIDERRERPERNTVGLSRSGTRSQQTITQSDERWDPSRLDRLYGTYQSGWFGVLGLLRTGCAVAVDLHIWGAVSPTKACGSLLVKLSWSKRSRCRLLRAAAGGLAISDRESPDSGPTKVCGLLLVELSWPEPSRCRLLI